MVNPENREPIEKKCEVVPVEQIIPNIKPESEVKRLENVGYGTNDFNDPYILKFFENQIRTAIEYGDDEDFSNLRERFKNQVIIDLGAGNSKLGYCLSCLLGAKGYVAVDAFYEEGYKGPEGMTKLDVEKEIEDLSARYKVSEKEKEVERLRVKGLVGGINIETIPASLIKGDMLDFLRRLPDKSVSIFTFGIDNNIILNQNYGKVLGNEVNRVLSPDGGYIKSNGLFDVVHPKNTESLSLCGIDLLVKKAEKKVDE
ncbi:MAG: hypothetical protein Q8Q48_04565 [Candidatus Staskawiczbacteria bacterium]|nr:hypothetical protein [Candidatus Staskawiczbacteria bacterium]